MNFEHIMFTNHIVFKSGTLGVCTQNTFRCSISVTMFSVLIWDTFFAVYVQGARHIVLMSKCNDFDKFGKEVTL